MSAFLDAQAAELGPNAVYVLQDQVGMGRVLFLASDVLIKRKTHRRVLELAWRATVAKHEHAVTAHVGTPYSHAPANKRGFFALTGDGLPAEDAEEATRWHQMADN